MEKAVSALNSAPRSSASASASSAYYAPESVAGVLNRVRSKLPQMSGAMAKIGGFLIDKPQAPLELSIKELAQETGTSAATVTRFCRLLGYTGYVPFRVSLAADLGRSTARDSWKADIGRAFGPDDSPADVLSTLVNAHLRSIEDTAEAIDLRQLKNVARRVSLARHVDIYGIGGSAVMALELQSRFYRIGIPAHHWTEVHAGLTSASLQDTECVAIAISNTGRTQETIEMLRQASTVGATTVALSSDASSPLAEEADFTITTTVHEQFLQPDDLSAKHVQLLAIDLLYLLVAQENFPTVTASLAASAVAVAPHRRAAKGSAGQPYTLTPAEQMARLTPRSVERKRQRLV